MSTLTYQEPLSTKVLLTFSFLFWKINLNESSYQQIQHFFNAYCFKICIIHFLFHFVPFTRCFYDHNINLMKYLARWRSCQVFHYTGIILLRKITATKNEVVLSYFKVRGLYFLAVIFARLYILYHPYLSVNDTKIAVVRTYNSKERTCSLFWMDSETVSYTWDGMFRM